MTETTYTLDPCSACNRYLQSKGSCNLHQLNNCFTETAAAFTGIPSNDSFRGKGINIAWEKCMDGLTDELGRTPCELRMAKAPVWVQTPHFFPDALVQTGDKNQAYNICMTQCESLGNNKEQCKINCGIDRDTVVSVNPPVPQQVARGTNQADKSGKITRTVILVLAILLLIAILVFGFKKFL